MTLTYAHRQESAAIRSEAESIVANGDFAGALDLMQGHVERFMEASAPASYSPEFFGIRFTEIQSHILMRLLRDVGYFVTVEALISVSGTEDRVSPKRAVSRQIDNITGKLPDGYGIEFQKGFGYRLNLNAARVGDSRPHRLYWHPLKPLTEGVPYFSGREAAEAGLRALGFYEDAETGRWSKAGEEQEFQIGLILERDPDKLV